MTAAYDPESRLLSWLRVGVGIAALGIFVARVRVDGGDSSHASFLLSIAACGTAVLVTAVGLRRYCVDQDPPTKADGGVVATVGAVICLFGCAAVWAATRRIRLASLPE